MSQTTIEVTTPRGTMPVHVHRPDGDGPFPRVVLYMDAPGIRPALFGHAERLAGAGYTAILPDLYYPFDPADRPDVERMTAGDPEEFARMRKLVAQIDDDDGPRGHAPAARGGARRDGGAWAASASAWAAASACAPPRRSEPTSRRPRCCTPRGLVTDEPDSPHLEVDRVDASLYLGFGEDDSVTPLSTIPPLREQLEQAGVAHRIEIFAGAEHGFTMPGRPAYDEAAPSRRGPGRSRCCAGE